jgi:hypothetical protein
VRTVLIAMALLAMLAGLAAADDGVRLLYKFEPGQTLEYEMTIAGSGVTTVTPEGAEEPAQTVPMEMDGVMTMTQQVVQMYEDDSALLEIVVNGLEMDMTVDEGGGPQKMHMKFTPDKLIVTGPQGTQEISLSEEGMQATPIGAPMQMRMSPRGELLAVSFQGMEQLSAMTGMDLSQMLKPAETPFPDRELSPGESWAYELDFPSPAKGEKIEMAMQATLQRVEGEDATRVATVVIEGDIDLSGMAIEAPAGGASPGEKLSFDTLEETLSGEFAFDVSGGVMTQAAYDLDVTTAMKVPGKEGGPPATVRSEMSMKMEMRLK